jgi:hypothetical protein
MFLRAAHRVLAVHALRRLASTGGAAEPEPGDEVETEVEIDDDGELVEQETHAVADDDEQGDDDAAENDDEGDDD